MAGFDDLIPAAMPYLATEQIPATAEATWQWDYELVDDTDTPIDISAGFTFTVVIATKSGSVVCTPTTSTPSTGVLRCTVSPTVSAAVPEGIYYHEVTITRTSDGAKIVAVGAGDAKFIVKKAVS